MITWHKISCLLYSFAAHKGLWCVANWILNLDLHSPRPLYWLSKHIFFMGDPETQWDMTGISFSCRLNMCDLYPMDLIFDTWIFLTSGVLGNIWWSTFCGVTSTRNSSNILQAIQICMTCIECVGVGCADRHRSFSEIQDEFLLSKKESFFSLWLLDSYTNSKFQWGALCGHLPYLFDQLH